MSLTTSEMSAADFAAVCGNNRNNDGGMFGNDWAWLIILILFGYGRGFGGFGGGFGGQGASCGCSPCATQADLAAGFNNSAVLSNLNDLALGQAGIQQTLCQGFNGVNTTVLQGFNGVDNAICNLGYNVQGGFNALSSQLAQCCCDNRAAIADVKYAMATESCATRNTIQNTTRDIIDNANANSRAILDFMVQSKLADKDAKIAMLEGQVARAEQNAFITANQEAQTATLLRRLGAECPSPAYLVNAPTPVTFPVNGCGQVQFANPCNTGCGCGSY